VWFTAGEQLLGTLQASAPGSNDHDIIVFIRSYDPHFSRKKSLGVTIAIVVFL
jgi:hypothetical protein